jgi:CubicO group peptidase (beta-lactamase class C family)
MRRHLKTAYFKVLAIALLICAVFTSIAQIPTTTQEIKTDGIAHKAIRLLNAHLADSVYSLAGEAFKQQITLTLWRQLNKTQFVNLLPFTNLTFKGSDNGINKYKLDGSKAPLQLNISLDDYDKIANFSFTPYRDEVKAQATMTETEKKTDVIAKKVLGFLNAHQSDSAYAFAGERFRKFMSADNFKTFNQNQLITMLPFPDPVFVGSKNGINRYKIGQLQFLIGLDKNDQYETMFIQPYHEDATKAEKAPTDNPMRSKLDSVVDKWLSSYIQTKGNVGISAAVYYKGADHYYNYGETVKDNHQLPDSHTLYEIGSISKTFTTTLLAKAVTDGLVSLDDPITKFLPDSVTINPYLKFITLKLLSNHTSGLPRMPDNINITVTDLSQPYEHYDEAHMFAYLKNFKSARGAGISYEYSNLAVSLLGIILEKIYHKPYEELLKQYITQPLQLNDTKITLTGPEVKRLAQGYDAINNPVAAWRHLSTKSAGAIKSSSANMLQYGKYQLEQFTGPLAKAIRLTHLSTLDDGVNNVGLGWHYLYKDTDPVLQHTGATGGYRAAIAVNLNRNMVIVVLTNNATTGDALGLQLTEALEKALLN